MLKKLSLFSFACVFLLVLHADCNAQYRPDVFFREDWKEIPAATPITQEHVATEGLELGLYGPAADSLRKSHHDQPADDPYYVWSGRCQGNWAVTLRSTDAYVDLSEYAKVVWRSKQSGLRCLHLILKLADGTWLISDQCDDQSQDWRLYQFNIADVDWRLLDIDTVVEGKRVANPDLSRVDEIGFTDGRRGGGTDASSRLDWIEVHGEPVDR